MGRSQVIDLDGPVHYVDHGGEGRPLVLIHGLGGSHLNWMAVADALTAHHRVYALDLAGFGLTPLSGRRATLTRNRCLIDDFISGMGFDSPVTLAGNSMGGLLVMISHGISTGALFLLIGMLYERRHTRSIDAFGGLARVAPWFAVAFVITALASIGLPGTSGFVGEFLALVGAFEASPAMGMVAATGVIFAAFYMLPMVRKLLFNALDEPENRAVEDLNGRERSVILPLLALMIILGLFPTPILRRMEPSVRLVIERVEAARAGEFDGEVVEVDVRNGVLMVDPARTVPGLGIDAEEVNR